jgi:hypothetical protein
VSAGLAITGYGIVNAEIISHGVWLYFRFYLSYGL